MSVLRLAWRVQLASTSYWPSASPAKVHVAIASALLEYRMSWL